MNQIIGVMKIHLRDKWSWLYLPWLILCSSFVVNIVVSLFIEEPMYTGGIMSIYIFMLVSGLMILPQTFPFALGFNVRRTDFFMGTVFVGLLVNAASAIMLFLLSIVENKLTGGWGTELNFFHLPYLNDGPAIGQIWIYMVLLTHMYFCGLAISTIHRRFGKIGMYIFSISSILIFSVLVLMSTYFHWWGDIIGFLSGYSAVELASGLFLLVIIYLLFSYLMLRKATVS